MHIDRVLFHDEQQYEGVQTILPALQRRSSYSVDPIVPVNLRVCTKTGYALGTASRIQVFYNQAGELSFFVLRVDKFELSAPGEEKAGNPNTTMDTTRNSGGAEKEATDSGWFLMAGAGSLAPHMSL